MPKCVYFFCFRMEILNDMIFYILRDSTVWFTQKDHFLYICRFLGIKTIPKKNLLKHPMLHVKLGLVKLAQITT
jgi:hypothetical protein